MNSILQGFRLIFIGIYDIYSALIGTPRREDMDDTWQAIEQKETQRLLEAQQRDQDIEPSESYLSVLSDGAKDRSIRQEIDDQKAKEQVETTRQREESVCRRIDKQHEQLRREQKVREALQPNN